MATTTTQKLNLYDLLGHPVTGDSSDLGTVYTASPETNDEGGELDLLIGVGTDETRREETYDDDTVLMSLADRVGTCESKSDETYDDDTMLPFL